MDISTVQNSRSQMISRLCFREFRLTVRTIEVAILTTDTESTAMRPNFWRIGIFTSQRMMKGIVKTVSRVSDRNSAEK